VSQLIEELSRHERRVTVLRRHPGVDEYQVLRPDMEPTSDDRKQWPGTAVTNDDVIFENV
jgi:hypothetical protein